MNDFGNWTLPIITIRDLLPQDENPVCVESSKEDIAVPMRSMGIQLLSKPDLMT